jgi:hypothetical protein
VNEEPEGIAVREIVREILRYLDHYPEAKDTLNGIAQWWLRREPSAQVLQDVERAVIWMLGQGFLLETRRPGISPYYWLNPQRRETIAKFLKGTLVVHPPSLG